MPLISSKPLLLAAQKGGYAVAALNIENMETAIAALRAAEELQAPVILQTTPSSIRYASAALFAGMVRALAEASPVPAALHLDHGSSVALGQGCIAAGYTSVMFDGSALPFEENLAQSAEMAQYAKARGIQTEAELGKVGGKEDDLEAEADTNTDPAQAAEFVARTGVDSLAVAIGTAHGFYVGTPVLDKERLRAIRRVVEIPLVLHGASGVPLADVKDCIAQGICKVNYATELRVAYTAGVKAALAANPKAYDPKELGKAAIESVCAAVKEKILACGSAGAAI